MGPLITLQAKAIECNQTSVPEKISRISQILNGLEDLKHRLFSDVTFFDFDQQSWLARLDGLCGSSEYGKFGPLDINLDQGYILQSEAVQSTNGDR